MLIRPATLVDLNACLTLNADSQTDHVWQMEQREENHTIAIRFQPVRLPRVMYVAYPRQRDDLFACWENGATILVATSEPGTGLRTDGVSRLDVSKRLQDRKELEPAPVLGYCQLDPLSWQQTGWITHLIVNRPFRRRGLGTALLKAGIAWGRDKGLSRLMVAVQTKNYPALSFFQKRRFSFCGFNDHYFVNMDIAVFFTLKI